VDDVLTQPVETVDLVEFASFGMVPQRAVSGVFSRVFIGG